MKAVCFDATVPGFLAASATRRVWPSAMLGPLGTVGLREVAEPDLPGPEWVKLEVIACGVCGTDLSTVTYNVSLGLEPFGSFPAVLGHEILAKVVECGDAVTGLDIGQRVAVDPTISCTMRGFSEESTCASCRRDHAAACLRGADEGETHIGDHTIGPGLTMGYHRDLPGGFSERIIAHQGQLHPVDDGLEDRVAGLFEPLSIAVHAILGTENHRREPVLIIGSGPIAMGVVWALRANGFRGEIVTQTKRDHEKRMALLLGASQNIRPGDEARRALLATGTSVYKPIVGREVYSGGGFPLIFDCVGNQSSLDQAIRFASVRGRLVVVGCAASVPDLDLTWLWARELTIKGFVGYGREEWRGRSLHTFQVTSELLRDSDKGLAELVTHTFSLTDYRAALSAARNHGTSGAIKVRITP